MKLLFDCHFQNFRTTLLYNQTVSPSLLFLVNGASERNVIPEAKRGDNSQLSYRNSMLHGLALMLS